MEFLPTSIAGAFEVRLKVHGDPRGRFKRHYCQREFETRGIAASWVQVNHSITIGRGTVRGLHYQHPPSAEDKLVSCTVGRAFDVAVDLRKGSPTFMRWARVELGEATMFFIPKGCAHGFQALENETHLLYLHSEFYAPEAEGGIRFDEPKVGIEWPLPITNISKRDGEFLFLSRDFEGLDV